MPLIIASATLVAALIADRAKEASFQKWVKRTRCERTLSPAEGFLPGNRFVFVKQDRTGDWRVPQDVVKKHGRRLGSGDIGRLLRAIVKHAYDEGRLDSRIEWTIDDPTIYNITNRLGIGLHIDDTSGFWGLRLTSNDVEYLVRAEGWRESCLEEGYHECSLTVRPRAALPIPGDPAYRLEAYMAEADLRTTALAIGDRDGPPPHAEKYVLDIWLPAIREYELTQLQVWQLRSPMARP